MGEAHLQKAEGFQLEHNWTQSLRFSESALKSLMKLTGRSLEVIEFIDNAMSFKYNALNFMGQNKEALECAKERYSLWAAGHMRHYRMLYAAFPLIDGLMHNEEYEQAELIARTAYEMITARYDNIVPEDQRQRFLADGSRLFADATRRLAETGGIAPEEKKKTGEKAIALASKALEIHTQLHGAVSAEAANDMGTLANVLKFFDDADDDEILRLYEQAKAIYSQVHGSLSQTVAVTENHLAAVYETRAFRARDANDLNRCVMNLELALSHFRAAEQIFRAVNHVNAAGIAARAVCITEERLLEVRIR